MIALGILGIAMLALLSLHHQNLQSVIRAQELSQAAMLAQGLMTTAEMERFPPVGTRSGDFERIYPRIYPGYRWKRTVEESGMFPDVRKVEITVSYGPRFRNSFTIDEFLHNPQPIVNLPQGQSLQAQPLTSQPMLGGMSP